MVLLVQKAVKKINLIFLIILPFVDVITALITRYNIFPISLGVIIKAIYSLVLLIYILWFSNSKYKNTFIKYLICMIVFCLIYIITKPHIWNLTSLLNEFINLYKYLFTGYIFFSFLILEDDLKYEDKFYKNIMLYSLIAYSLFMVIPFLTQTDFATYPSKSNLGSIGWFYSANEVSAIFIILFPFFFLKLKEIKNKNKYYFLLLILLIVPSIFMIGTKVSWYGVIIQVGMMSYFTFKKNKNNKFLSTSILSIFCIMCLLSFVAPTNKNINKTIDRTNTSTTTNETHDKQSTQKDNEKETCGTFHKLNEILKNKTLYKIINISLSGRQNKAYTLWLLYQDSNPMDKFFGIGFTNNEKINSCYVEKYVEMDPIDILIHYGIVGLIVVLIPFVYVIKKIDIFNIKNYSFEKLIYFLTVGLLFILSFLSGHIIGYPAVSIYLALLLVMIFNSKTEKNA